MRSEAFGYFQLSKHSQRSQALFAAKSSFASLASVAALWSQLCEKDESFRSDLACEAQPLYRQEAARVFIKKLVLGPRSNAMPFTLRAKRHQERSEPKGHSSFAFLTWAKLE